MPNSFVKEFGMVIFGFTKSYVPHFSSLETYTILLWKYIQE